MTKGKVSAKQKKFIEALLSGNFGEDGSGLYTESGIDENTFHKWLSDEEFKQYMEEAVAVHMMGENPKVIKSLIEQCIKGNATALKIYFDLRSRGGASVHGVMISDDVPLKK